MQHVMLFVFYDFFFTFLRFRASRDIICIVMNDNIIKVRFSLTFKNNVIFILVSYTKSTCSTMTGTK